jgi:hypothetical protein
VTAVATLLYLMFSTGAETVHKEGLFGSLFFETTPLPDGGTGVNMGVAHPAGLIIVFLLFAAFLVLVQFCYRLLKNYRAQLIKERSHS